LRRIWNHFVEDGQFDAARPPIAASWQRSRAAGMDPSGDRAPTLADRHDAAARWEAHPLEAAAPLIRGSLGAVADASEHLIVVSNADGELLWVDGRPKLRSAAADAMNFVEGALWSEGGAGTNAIGTALAADHPVQVHAAEHFSEIVHDWTCSAAPVHDPEDGRLLGVIDLTGRMTTAHPHSFAVALATARAVESDLRVRLHERDALLRVRYLPHSTSSREPFALVSRSGRVIADHPAGFLRAERIDLPAGGGELVLPSGRPAVAEVVQHDEVFVVRARLERHTSRKTYALHSTSVANHVSTNSASRDAERRRTRKELHRLAEEQAALRRVATLVAGQAAPDEIFAAVAEEVAQLLRAERGAVTRYEPDDSMTVMSHWSGKGRGVPVGTTVALRDYGVDAAVKKTGGPSRLDYRGGASGPLLELTGALSSMPRSTVGAPIVVDGRVWGAILATTLKSEPFPADTEARTMRFAELVATAISNAVGRAELAASRARIVATADETRRRIERDLHDGAQQRLVSLALELHAVEAKIPSELDELRGELSRVARGLAAAMEDLHEISRGIHPAIVSRGGLGPALKSLCRRAAVPVELVVGSCPRLPESVEVAAYYVVSEALTNVAKHASASTARVSADVRDGILQLAVRDDGVGGADPRRGSGLIGLRDRVDAMGGTLVVESPVRSGTSLLVALPVKPPSDPWTRAETPDD
jgi:signal transduction histidine kinase